MELRELTAEDFYILSEIFASVADDITGKIEEAENEKQLGILIFAAAFKQVPTRIKAFIENLTGEPAKKQGFTTPLKVTRELMKRQEFKDFLEEAKLLLQEIREQ